MRPAFAYYVETKDVPKALAVAEYGATHLVGSSGGVQLLTEALSLVVPDSHEAGGILAQYGGALESELGDFDGAIKALEQALAISRREGDLLLAMNVLRRLATIQVGHTQYQEGLRNSLSAIELESRIGRGQVVGIRGGTGDASPHWNAARALIALGAIKEAEPHAAAYLAMAEKTRHRFELAQALQLNQFLAYFVGNFEAARTFSDQGLSVDQQDVRLLHNRAILEFQVGEFDQGDTYLDRLLEAMRLTPPGPVTVYAIVPLTIGLAVRITGKASRFYTATQAAEPVLLSPTVTPFYATYSRTGLALLAVEQCDKAAAEEQYVALKAWSSTMSPLMLVRVDRVLGLLSHTMGNFDQATVHFEDALTFCRKANYRPELAWSCSDYAQVLFQRNASGDSAKAVALLDECLAISSEFGMRPLMERVVSRQEILRA
jgi:tetratricopeptide (TPR) repeat protein